MVSSKGTHFALALQHLGDASSMSGANKKFETQAFVTEAKKAFNLISVPQAVRNDIDGDFNALLRAIENEKGRCSSCEKKIIELVQKISKITPTEKKNVFTKKLQAVA